MLHDDWRRKLNGAVRQFAAAALGVDDDGLRGLAVTMLREIGETLGVDCGAVLELSDADPAAAPRYQWCRLSAPLSSRPFDAPGFQSIIRSLTLERRPIVLTSALEPRPDGPLMAEAHAYLRRTAIRIAAIVPIGVGDRPTWTWVFGTVADDYIWADPVLEHMQVVGDIIAGILQRSRPAGDGELRASADRLTMRERPASIRTAFPSNRRFEEIVGQSRALRTALAALEEVVDTDSSVMLLGETGTGKELFARALHARGPRRSFPLVCVNCAALPPTLIESELFGHQRGAFTGALTLRQGRFELAHRGTLFLDEIGDLPLDLQPKLLRVLQEGAFERVGSSQSHTVDVRIVAATHCDLARAVAEAEFRADLYYRLNVFPIRVPALRERLEDIPALVWSIIRKRQGVLQRHIATVPADVMTALQQYSWPGNIRELENVIERALIHTTGDTLTLLEGSLEATDDAPVVGTTLMSVERAHIEDVLRDCGWRINGNGNAAERLGLHPNTLRFRMKKLGIVRHDSAHRLRSASESEARGRAS
jgi:formate hydrogenlyase transcriptional activator